MATRESLSVRFSQEAFELPRSAMTSLAYLPALTLLLALVSTITSAQTSSRSTSSADPVGANPSTIVNDPPQAPQPQNQVPDVASEAFSKALELNATWAKQTRDIDERASTYVKVGAAVIGVVAAGVGGGLHLDKNYTHAASLVSLSGGVVGGGLNIFALIKYKTDKKNLDARNREIPDPIKSYIGTNFPNTNIRTLPSHPEQFSNILNAIQIQSLSNTLHQQ